MVEQLQVGSSPSTAPGASRTPDLRCMYCDGAEVTPLFAGVRDRLQYVSGTWEFVKCRKCGSALLWPQPDPAELPSFYPPVYSFRHGLEERSRIKRILNWLEYRLFFRPQYQSQARSVLSRIGLPRERTPTLLDIGCGRGLRLQAFQAAGFQCAGTDFQEDVAEDVRRHLGIPVAICEARGLPEHYAPESFDVITAFFLLEHVPDVVQVLNVCYDLLRPGGWMVAAVPLADSVQCSLFGRRWIEVTEAPRHLSLPTRAGLDRVFQRAGFERIEVAPDSCLTNAGEFALSLIPASATTRTYGVGSRWSAAFVRCFGGVVALCAVPMVLFENYALRRPATGLAFARRPAAIPDSI